MIGLCNTLARLCGWLSERLADAQNRLARCPDCGELLYYTSVCRKGGNDGR
jgi:predicted RNA-binding Zn-ribbon protein involved in translation (DUF1610 family)